MSSWSYIYADFLRSSLEQAEDVDQPDVTLPPMFNHLSWQSTSWVDPFPIPFHPILPEFVLHQFHVSTLFLQFGHMGTKRTCKYELSFIERVGWPPYGMWARDKLLCIPILIDYLKCSFLSFTLVSTVLESFCEPKTWVMAKVFVTRHHDWRPFADHYCQFSSDIRLLTYKRVSFSLKKFLPFPLYTTSVTLVRCSRPMPAHFATVFWWRSRVRWSGSVVGWIELELVSIFLRHS